MKTKIFKREIPTIQLKPKTNFHDLLYVEARMLEEKKERLREKYYDEICTFKPLAIVPLVHLLIKLRPSCIDPS